MKWTKAELLRLLDNHTFELDTDVQFAKDVFQGVSGLKGIQDVHVQGDCWYQEEQDEIYFDLHITGIMLCPDSITGQLLEVDLDTQTAETYVFKKPVFDEDDQEADDSVRFVNNDVIDLLPAVIDAILLEVPLQVTIASEDDYPSGDGWKVYSEAEYQESQKQQIDPRLAKLKQFKDE